MRPIVTASLFVLALGAASSALAADPPASGPNDLDALNLADRPLEAPKKSTSNFRLFGEAGAARNFWRTTDSYSNEARLSLDLRYDARVSQDFRLVLSDRLDLVRGNVSPRETYVNTLREAYLSWQPRPDTIADAGRVNLRYGAALGYNPTDYFREGAVRYVVSPDPASLRENRQGTVVIQGQRLWSGGSLAAVLSPKLGSSPSDATFSLNAGATNPRDRWLLVGSHKFTETFNPQILLFGDSGSSPQFGLNLTGLVNDATVAFLEFSTGKGRSLTAQALGLAEPEQQQRRAALGLTYTTSFNLSLTAEYEYNSAAPDKAQWDAFRLAAPGNSLRLLSTSQALQDLAVREALFLYAAWRDAGLKNLDVSAFVRADLRGRSRDQWIEARYRWRTAEVALQWQGFTGNAVSLFGAVPRARRIDLLWRLYL